MRDVGLEAGALDRIGPAVRSPEQPMVLQYLQIAPDGLCRDLQLVGDVADRNVPGTSGMSKDQSATLVPLLAVQRPDLLVVRLATTDVSVSVGSATRASNDYAGQPLCVQSHP